MARSNNYSGFIDNLFGYGASNNEEFCAEISKTNINVLFVPLYYCSYFNGNWLHWVKILVVFYN